MKLPLTLPPSSLVAPLILATGRESDYRHAFAFALLKDAARLEPSFSGLQDCSNHESCGCHGGTGHRGQRQAIDHRSRSTATPAGVCAKAHPVVTVPAGEETRRKKPKLGVLLGGSAACQNWSRNPGFQGQSPKLCNAGRPLCRQRVCQDAPCDGLFEARNQISAWRRFTATLAMPATFVNLRIAVPAHVLAHRPVPPKNRLPKPVHRVSCPWPCINHKS